MNIQVVRFFADIWIWSFVEAVHMKNLLVKHSDKTSVSMNAKFSGEISISTFMFQALTFQRKSSKLIKCLF